MSLYNGNVHIWNYESQQLVKSFEVGDNFRLEMDWAPFSHLQVEGVRSSFSHLQVCDLPVRAAVFVPRKNWVVTGSDDMQVDTILRLHFD